jgi:isochorismate pyruvate lyase
VKESARPKPALNEAGPLAPRVAAADCRQMSEVRAEIDRIDRRLVALLAERQSYIEAAARIKPYAEEVRLAWRIEDVVAKVLKEAEARGLSKRIAEPVWRELIDRCIDHEHAAWRSFHSQNENR